MTGSTAIVLLVCGCLIGVVSGLIGIGGGVLVVPLLVFFFRFNQQTAIGTSLAMLLPPIGLLAVIDFYKHGNVNLPFAILLACGFAFGALGGARVVNLGLLGEHALRVLFGVLMLYVAGKNLFTGSAREGRNTALLMLAFGLAWIGTMLLGKKWNSAANWTDVYRKKLHQDPPCDYQI
jgi:uncharacterized membrane protein YfcA